MRANIDGIHRGPIFFTWKMIDTWIVKELTCAFICTRVQTIAAGRYTFDKMRASCYR